MRIGVDVGGTNTDAVLLDGGQVLAKVKSSTTTDVSTGIQRALAELAHSAEASLSDVDAVMIGTTHFTNAFIEGRQLNSVAVVRLCLPATQGVPPLADWPAGARSRLVSRTFFCHGGHEFDGRRISPIDRDELLRAASEIDREGLESIAVTGVFSSVNPEDELLAGEILSEALPHVPISLSHEIGRLGMLERENATIVNACLSSLARRTVAAFQDAVAATGVDAPVFVSQNDGTLADMAFTERYPVTTFTSGPTNSMRGAALLSGVSHGVVVDIGGTTADLGILEHGFPRETTTDARVGGVRTNFRLPDIVSLGIGGGSVVGADLPVRVGPVSVGYALTSQALVFGGDTLTATDLAVADGRADVGDRTLVSHLDPAFTRAALAHIEAEISEAVDRMRTSADPLPVILVGGGSILLGDDLAGAAQVHRPAHYEVANAVGAAIAQVGGACERIYSLAQVARDDAIEEASAAAHAAAVEAGADPATVRVIEIDEVAMAYLPGAQTRIKVKAVGDLQVERRHALHR